MGKRSLEEMVELSKKMKFDLPDNITSHKQLLSDGRYSYVFRHDELGELGRIFIIPHGTQSQICSEVVGELDDPMTKKRKEIFEPISKEILAKMGLVCGDGKGKPKPYVSPPEDKHMVQSMIYPCHTCNEVTAMLVFAVDADNKAHLEDYARLMYAKAKELGVPTWIVGKETENIVNGKDLRKSLVLKIHPEREEAKMITPDDLMDIVDELTETHCRGYGKIIDIG